MSGAFALTSCKRATSSRNTDGGAPTSSSSADGSVSPAGGPTPALASWDGMFGGVRTAKGDVLLAVAGAKTPSLGFVQLGRHGEEIARFQLISLAKPLSTPPSVAAFSDGGAVLIYAERLGEAPVARMFSNERKGVGEAAPVGADWCNTGDALYFLEQGTRRLRRWQRGELQPRPPEGPTFADHSTPLCGAREAFVLEPRDAAFDVVVASTMTRARVADGVDPRSAGNFAAYVADDVVGVVALSGQAQGALRWSTVGADAKVNSRAIVRQVASEQTLIAADGASNRVSLLFQREGRGRCGEEETPPVYEIVEVGVGEQLITLPTVACDSEASPPDIQQTKAGTVVRWFEWKEGKNDKTLRYWSRLPTKNMSDAGLPSANAKKPSLGEAGGRPVSADTFLLECDEERCLSVGREGDKFRLVTTP